MNKKPNEKETGTHKSNINKVIFILGTEQINFLDRFVFEVKQQSGYRLNKSEVVRALIDHLETADINPAEVSSPEKLKDLLDK